MRAPFAPLILPVIVGLGGFLAACQTTVPMETAAGPAPAVTNPAPPPAPAPQPEAPAVKTPPPENLDIAAPEPVEPEPLRLEIGAVAVILPLSGPTGSLGQSLMNAVELALFEIADDQIELLVYDSQGTVTGAENAARLAVDDGASLIVGPLFAHSAIAVRPIAAAAGINVLTLSNNREAAGGSVFLMGHLPGQQVSRVVDYATDRGIIRFGLLAPQNGFGGLVADSLGDTVARRGGVVTRSSWFDPSSDDLAPSIRDFADYDRRKAALKAEKAKLASRTDAISKNTLARLENMDTWGDPDYDGLLIPSGGSAIRNIGPLLAFYDVDPKRVRFLGTAQWENSTGGSLAGLGAEPSLVGGWYAAPDPAARADFERRYQNAWGEKPPRIATLAYDAMALAAVLGQAEDGPDFSVDQLTQPLGFAGTDGLFRLLPDGTNQRGLAVLEVRRDGPTVIDPAPLQFDNLAN